MWLKFLPCFSTVENCTPNFANTWLEKSMVSLILWWNTFQEQGSSNYYSLQNITLMRSKILLQRGLENFCPSVYYLITIFTLPVSKVHSCFIIQNFNFFEIWSYNKTNSLTFLWYFHCSKKWQSDFFIIMNSTMYKITGAL